MSTVHATQRAGSHSVVQGFVEAGFERVADELAKYSATSDDFSAQFCAYVRGRCVADIWVGPDLHGADLLGIFSATKGAAAISIAALVDRGVLNLEAAVSRYWPEFAACGKDTVSVRMALSHQAGLVGVEPQFSLEQLLDHDHVAGRLAAQVPHWRPGSAFGYHALTIGTVMDELVRRVDGRSVAAFFREEIAEPRQIDVHIGCTLAEETRVRELLPQRPTAEESAVLEVAPPPWADPASLAGMAFNSIHLDIFSPPLPNHLAVRKAGFASAGGVASAGGLARLYAHCIGDVDGHARLLTPETVAEVSQIQASGQDLVLGAEMRFGVGFMLAHPGLPFGSHQAFGHDGAGGAIAGADPWFDMSFGYIPGRMYFPGGADPHGLGLADVARRCLTAGGDRDAIDIERPTAADGCP